MRIRGQADIDEGVAHLAKVCNVMRAMAAEVGEVPLRLSTPDFAGLAAIIVSQQVSRASADAIFGRLTASVQPLTAERFLEAGEAEWRAAGLSRPKQRTLSAIATAVGGGSLHLGELCDLPVETAMENLTAIKGVGTWTAEVYLMFCAGHRDVFPAGDLALQEAIRIGLALDVRPGDKHLREIAERWQPWRAVAARVLWAYYGTVKRDAIPV